MFEHAISVIQNRCKMHGRCIVGGNNNTAYERAILFIQYLYIDDTRSEA